MKTLINLLFVTAVIALPCAGQITIHNTDLPLSGFTYAAHLMSNADFNVGSAGESQTWTFGTYTWDHSEIVEIVDPDNTPYANLFPTASRAIHATDSSTFRFELIEENNCSMLGTASPEVTYILDDAVLVMTLPAVYGIQWNTVGTYSHELEPGMMMTLVDSAHVVIDGWGTVITPYGPHDVLRLFSHHYTKSYLNDALLSSTENLGYSWVNRDGIGIVSVESEIDDINPNFTFGFIEMREYAFPVGPPTGIPGDFAVGAIYPNPFNATAFLPVELSTRAEVMVNIFDVTGRTVERSGYLLGAGRHDIMLSGAGWTSGSYFARVSINGRFETRRVLLVR